MWSWESTETPTAEPMTQWFGSGFGHRGSTSNCGASTPAAATAARLSKTAETTPSPVRSARKAATTRDLCFIIFLHFRALFVAGPPLLGTHRIIRTRRKLIAGFHRKRREFYTT